MTRKELIDLYLQIEPGTKEKTAISGAAQVWRFMNAKAHHVVGLLLYGVL